MIRNSGSNSTFDVMDMINAMMAPMKTLNSARPAQVLKAFHIGIHSEQKMFLLGQLISVSIAITSKSPFVLYPATPLMIIVPCMQMRRVARATTLLHFFHQLPQ